MAPGEKPHRHRDIYERLEKLEERAGYFYKEIGAEASRGYLLKRRVERLEALAELKRTPKEDNPPEDLVMGLFSPTCGCNFCYAIRHALRHRHCNSTKANTADLQAEVVVKKAEGIR